MPLSDECTWILNDSVDLQAYAFAVAEWVGLPIVLKRLNVTGPLGLLPARLQMRLSPARLLARVPLNEPEGTPLPCVIIAIGERSVPIALSLKSVLTPGCFALHIRQRKWATSDMDLVLAPPAFTLGSPRLMAQFDAVYHVNPKRRSATKEEDREAAQVGDVEIVANVIRDALGLAHPGQDPS